VVRWQWAGVEATRKAERRDHGTDRGSEGKQDADWRTVVARAIRHQGLLSVTGAARSLVQAQRAVKRIWERAGALVNVWRNGGRERNSCMRGREAGEARGLRPKLLRHTVCEAYMTRSTLLSLLGIALYAAEFSRHLHTCRSCSLPSPHPAHHTRFRHITNPRTHPLGRVTHLRFKQLFHRSCSNDYIANALLRLSENRGFSRILDA
jgi:hypothetical protein